MPLLNRDATPAITICVTAYNESAIAARFCHELHTFVQLAGFPVSIVVVDNGSTDNTFSEITQQAQLAGIAQITDVIRVEPNRGYGGGMLTALNAAKSPFVMMLPADCQYSPKDILRVCNVWSSLDSPREGFLVKGNRRSRDEPAHIIFLSWAYSTIVRSLLRVPASDINGLPKIFARQFVPPIGDLPDNAVFDAALLAWISSPGSDSDSEIDVIEIPVSFRSRDSGAASWKGREFRTAARMLWSLVCFWGRLKVGNLKTIESER